MKAWEKAWQQLRTGIMNLRDEVVVLAVTLIAVLFTRLWPAMVALWNSVPFTKAPWPGWGVLIPGVFFAVVLVAIDAARGTKADRNKVRMARLISLILSGLGVQNLIDQIDRMIKGGQ